MAITVRQWASLAVLIALVMILPGGLLPANASTIPLPLTQGKPSTSPFETSHLSAGSLPTFPTNLTHFVYIVRENHDFDDYLGDCSLNINDTCNGGKAYSSTSSGTASETSPSGNQVNGPDLHALAREYAVFDNMYSSVDPYSAQGHNYLFAANVWGGSDTCGSTVEGTGSGTQWGIYNNTNVQAGSCGWNGDLGTQTYSGAGGSIFDRFLGPNVPQSKTTLPFLADGDNVWELSSPSCTVTASKTIPGDTLNSVQVVTGCTNGYWMNTTSGTPSMPPTINPTTGIPQFLWECQFASGCGSTAPSTFLDSYAANSFTSFLTDYGLPTYTEVELMDDHPGSYCGQTDSICVQWNDAAVNHVVSAIENSTTLSKNTVIAITEDDTQNGANGMDHVNSGRRMPFVVVAPHTVMKSGGAPSTCGISSSYPSCGLVIHQTFNTSNVLAVMERVEMNVNPNVFVTGGISSNSNAFPMVQNDYLAEGNPLEPLWKCGQSGVPCNTGVSSSGPTITSFTAQPSSLPLGHTEYLNVTATGGTTPYSYAYAGLPAGCTTSNTATYSCVPSGAGTFSVTVTVTDKNGNAVTSNPVSFTVTSPSGLSITSFTAQPSSIPLGSTEYLNVTATGGTTPYSYAYTGLPAGCTTSNTATYSCVPTATGPFTVTVTVTDKNSNTVTGTATFTVAAPPSLAITSFTALPGTIPPGGTTYLNVTATGGKTPYTYTYPVLPAGCASSNTKSLPCAPSATSGSLTATVTVTDSASATISKSVTFTVSAATPTLTTTTLTPTSSVVVSTGGTATFYGQGLDQFGNPISSGLTYQWSLNPTTLGTVSPASGTGNTTTFTAGTAAGAVGTLTLSVTSGQNLVTKSASITLFGATATESKSSGTAPLTVSFTATASGGTSPYSYLWDFGDSNGSIMASPTYTYARAGTFTPKVTVTDSLGHLSTMDLSAITVTGGSPGSQAITVTITANPLTGYVPLAVTFQAAASGGSGGYTSYAWSFGDNDRGAGNPVSHTYTGTGTFLVEVTVTDVSGITGHGFANVTVSQTLPGSATSSTPWMEYAAVGAVVILAVALVAVLAGRKKRPGYEPPPQGTTGTRPY